MIPDRTLLELRDISVYFGNVAALSNVSFTVERGTIVGVVGPNGAGKSTTMNVISGLIRPRQGSITWGSDVLELTHRPSHARAALGIGRTFQDTRLIAGLTVIDQLMCGAYSQMPYGGVRATLRMPSASKMEANVTTKARDLLSELGLGSIEYSRVDAIPSPVRRLVDFGRALMMEPDLLLLDEITAGTTDVEKESVMDIVRRRNETSGMTVFAIAHDLDFIRRIAHSVVVLVNGTVLAQGPTEEVLARADVLEAYVGE